MANTKGKIIDAEFIDEPVSRDARAHRQAASREAISNTVRAVRALDPQKAQAATGAGLEALSASADMIDIAADLLMVVAPEKALDLKKKAAAVRGVGLAAANAAQIAAVSVEQVKGAIDKSDDAFTRLKSALSKVGRVVAEPLPRGKLDRFTRR